MKYRIYVNEIQETFFEDLFKGLEWDTSDILLLACKREGTESDIITLDGKYFIIPCKLIKDAIIRLFLNHGSSYNEDYKCIINNSTFNREITNIKQLLIWKENIKKNNFYLYNLSLLEQNNLIKSDEINFYMSTTDSVLRKMFLEIIINKLNKLNDGNN